MNIRFKPYGTFANILLLLFLVFLCRNGLASIDSIASKNVKVEDDRVSVHVKGLMLGELVKEIKKSTGIEFDIRESLLEREVSVNFKELSLLEGIKKIIYPLNYAIIYNPDDEISKVIVIDEGNNSTMMAYNTNSFVSPVSYQYSEPSGHNPHQFNEQQVMEGDNEQVSHGSELFKSYKIPDPVPVIASMEGPVGTDAFIQEPPAPEIALIEGPQGTDIFVQEPPASETAQSEGPPGTDIYETQEEIDAPPGE